MAQDIRASTDFEPSPSVVVGDTADAYFQRAAAVLRAENLNPMVVMEFAAAKGGILCGVREVHSLLDRVLPDTEREVWALEDGGSIAAGEVVLRVKARYSTFNVYETAIAGTLSQNTAWATAARECVDAAESVPVVCLAARYAHPSVVGYLEYSAIVGGCATCSTAHGARMAGVTPWVSLPRGLILVMGDTDRAAQAYDRHVPQDIPRVIPVDTLRDEVEEALGVSRLLKERLRAVRIDPPQNRGATTPDLVKELRARLDLSGFGYVEIVITGGLTPERIREFVKAEAPVSTFGVGKFIASSPPSGFSGDIHEVDGKPIAKRGRIPGVTMSRRLTRIL